MSTPPVQSKQRKFPCAQCGAELLFKPGALTLTCPYCTFSQPIPADTQSVVELDFLSWLQRDVPLDATHQVLQCTNCAANFELKANEASGKCPFCGGNVVIPPKASGQIPPGCVLPFQIDKKECRSLYRKWVSGHFWAPNDLKKMAMIEGGLTGVYVPYWTYDSETNTQYTGLMGIDRIVTETYEDSEGNTQTRQRIETDWYPAAGQVYVPFDDVLILASDKVPAKFAAAMQSWQLPGLVSYRDEYLSGFQAARYDYGLQQGFESAKGAMAPVIYSAICRDIGGDRQQVHSQNTEYFSVTFKHVLLPIWAGAYRYKGKTWNYLVNGQTGEIRGDAPISGWKVFLAVVLGLIVLGVIFYLMSQGEK